MGTPRPGMGPVPRNPKHRFKGPQDAMQLLRRRRTREQIVKLARNSELAICLAKTFAWVNRHEEALLSEDYLRAFPKLPKGVCGIDSSQLTPLLAPQAHLLAQGLEVVTAYSHFLQAGEQLRATVKRFYEQHPWAREHTRLWQSEQRLFCAFSQLAVEAEGMGPKLSPQEMEALALVVGIRFPREEFEQDPKSNKQRKAAWKSMMREVEESGVLPLLRTIAAEHLPLGQEAVPPATPAMQQSVVSPPSTPPEAAEHSVGDGGDKK
ncbi:hypothetical protein JQX13_40280 [Archangium violaceum]|uniref:hypothetical protein n=1 Tax=Archangium violaceum TaxID=83451 RepID=UPI00193BFB6D|nr:hypothetical protein [Archangium violaceum]QRK06289.1 hypothetical protein JQX13_40280 [Archangium violaceum]